MKKNIFTVISLTAICGVVALLLALTNSITSPLIQKQEEEAVQNALKEVMPEGRDFKEFDVSDQEIPDTVEQVFTESGGGYVFKLNTTGYSSGLVLMCGVDAEGTVTGCSFISGSETLGYEATYGKELVGKNSDNVNDVATVAGATKTTGAYKNAVKDALNAFEQIKEESK